MLEIEGIDRVIDKLRPHLPRIEADFEKENNSLKSLLARDHETTGRVLKSHPIAEHYLDRNLSSRLTSALIQDAKLTFFQKASLLPSSASREAFVKPGLLKLNAIRNKLAHDLATDLSNLDLGPINSVLSVARPASEFPGSVERIEAFTTIACTWLIPTPPDLEQVFIDAFSEIRVQDPHDQ